MATNLITAKEIIGRCKSTAFDSNIISADAILDLFGESAIQGLIESHAPLDRPFFRTEHLRDWLVGQRYPVVLSGTHCPHLKIDHATKTVSLWKFKRKKVKSTHLNNRFLELVSQNTLKPCSFSKLISKVWVDEPEPETIIRRIASIRKMLKSLCGDKIRISQSKQSVIYCCEFCT